MRDGVARNTDTALSNGLEAAGTQGCRRPQSFPGGSRLRPRPSRLAGLKLALLAAGAAALLGCRERSTGAGGSPAANSGADLLLVTLDTTRADRIGAYGRANAHTPTLDALAESGVLFENAFTASPTTLPAHASIFTGSYPPSHGVRFNLRFCLSGRLPTLASVLESNGYATAAAVAAAVLDRKFGLDRGFSFYDDELTGGAAAAGTGLEERAADRVTDAALSALRKLPAGRPFFLWVHYYDPHTPYSPPRAFLDGCGGDAYQGEIAFVDSELGRLLRELRARSADGRPLLIAVLADHGEGLGDHGEDTHGLFVYDSTVRVPLLLSGGGLPSKRRVSAEVRSIDLMPTLLDLLGIAAPAGVAGRSLLPLVSGSETGDAREAYLETFLPRYSYGWSEIKGLRTSREKVVDAPRPELYDLAADPGERTNLIEKDPRAGARPLERLRALEAAMSTPASDDARAKRDPEIERRLAALGYVSGGGDGSGASGGPRPDPKDRFPVHREMERAQAFIQEGDVESARAIADELLRNGESNVFLLRLVGNSLADGKNARLDDALVYLRRAAELDPGDFDAHQKIGNVLLAKARAVEPADRAAARGLWEDALLEFEAARALNESAADAHNNVGIAKLLLGQTDDAEAAFLRALSLRPTLVSSRYNLGRLLDARGDLGGAVEQYREVLALRPGDTDAQVLLGLALIRRGDGKEAEEPLRAALEADASRLDALVPLVRLLRADRRSSEAEALLLRSDASAPAVSHLLGLCRLDRGDVAGAVEALGYASERAPDSADVLDDLAGALIRAGRPAEAAEAFGREAALLPSDDRPLYNRAVSLERAGREAEALAGYEAALRIAPENPETENALAWLLVTARDGAIRNASRALELAERACARAPANAAFLDTLAEAKLASGDREGAIAALEKAVEAAAPEDKPRFREKLEALKTRR